MSADPFDWMMLLARLEVGELPPERLPAEMTEAIRSGTDSPTVAAIAGLDAPTRRDLDDLLPGLVADIDSARPSRRQALKLVGDDLLRRIVQEDVAPCDGASKLGVLWRRQTHPAADHLLWEQFVAVYGIADEIADDPSHRSDYEGAIVESARARLDAGGFDTAAFGCDYCRDDANRFYGHVTQIASDQARRMILLRCPQCGTYYENTAKGGDLTNRLSAAEAAELFPDADITP